MNQARPLENMALSFTVLLEYLHQCISQLRDPRKESNATRYNLKDLVLGAFSAFFMQSESFLEYQRQLHSRCGHDNAQALFGLEKLASIPQIRNVLDGVEASGLSSIFVWCYQALLQRKYLKRFERLGKNLLIALDGVEYFSSEKIHCNCCSTQTHRSGKVTYSHKAIFPVIVAPDQEQVISLPPEFITPQDGHDKQDCEQNAAKRWIEQYAPLFNHQDVTLLGDDLFSHQPTCECCLKHQFNFLFVCLPESHKSLYAWVDYLEKNGELKTFSKRQWNGRYFEVWNYRYLNQVPLREQQPALKVNWYEMRVIRESDGEQLYHNSLITNHLITPQSIHPLGKSGRSRWKTENENHNVLKTQGYHLEHNFGHGQQHLAKFLVTLNLLAFLFHTILALVDEPYQQIRNQRGTRKGFFQDILALTKYLLFESWQHLLEFMLADSTPILSLNSS